MNWRAVLGFAFLSGLGVFSFLYAREEPWVTSLRQRLTDHLEQSRITLVAEFDTRPVLRVGDSVFTLEGEAFAPVGEVQSIEYEPLVYRVTLLLDPTVARRFGTGTVARAMAPRGDLIWAGKTLLTPALREELVKEMKVIWSREGEETMRRLRPFLTQFFEKVSGVLKESLPGVIERNKDKMNTFMTVLREEIYPHELEPALQDVLFPKLEERMSGVAGSIMSDVASKVEWGDAAGVLWSAAMNKIGIGDQKTVERKLIAILKKSALPVFRARGPELAKVAMKTTAEAMKDERVKKAMDRATEAVLEHEAFRAFITEVGRQWFLENEGLHEVLRESVTSSQLRTPLENLWRVAEPTLERYLEEMLTRSDREGMDHQLVRVLRRTVLHKDRRYVLLVPGGADRLVPGVSVLRGENGFDE